MALKRGNIFTPSPRVLLWSCTTFIMLSATVTTERQCYWCGPLAEQVHRSRRAPPCATPTAHVTACEPGFTHCAIVASSPPHVESRFCVKLYQDECYPLYCNSTKTWKMICPCRGDLCNGDNTERENRAFATLFALVTKSQNNRIRKREIATYRTVIITNLTAMEGNETKNNETNKVNNDDQMIVVRAATKGDLLTETTHNPTTYQTEKQGSSEYPFDDITTIKDSERSTVNLATINLNEATSQKEIEINSPITTMITKTETKSSSINDTDLKTSEQLPTAEALQQNSSPSSVENSKFTEAMKIVTIDSTHVTEYTSTVGPTHDSGNFAIRLPHDMYTFTTVLFTIIYNY